MLIHSLPPKLGENIYIQPPSIGHYPLSQGCRLCRGSTVMHGITGSGRGGASGIGTVQYLGPVVSSVTCLFMCMPS